MISKSVSVTLVLALWFWSGVGTAEEAASLRKGPWPVRDGRNYQPTERELEDMDRHDVRPDEAREIDRLYDELMSGDEKVSKRYPPPKR
jgi:hypothetical protein